MLQKPAGSEGLRIVRVEGYRALYPLFACLNLLSVEPQRNFAFIPTACESNSLSLLRI
jgi:hypothetical protein